MVQSKEKLNLKSHEGKHVPKPYKTLNFMPLDGPGNRDVRALHAQFKRVAAEASKRERKMFGNIFERMSAADERQAKKVRLGGQVRFQGFLGGCWVVT